MVLFVVNCNGNSGEEEENRRRANCLSVHRFPSFSFPHDGCGGVDLLCGVMPELAHFCAGASVF